MSGDLKAYTTGSECPPLEKGRLRLYSMRLCPYAQRARIVLEHKNIPYEEVNINLKDKPEWFFEKNPLGKVPCLEQDGTIVYESVVVCDYLDDVYPGPKLTPVDPYTKARNSMLLERYSQVSSNFYATLRSKGEDKEPIDKLYQGLTMLENELATRGTDFLGGDEPMLIDFEIWPHLERVNFLKFFFPHVDVKVEAYPKLTAWIARMSSVPAVKKTITSPKTHMMFLKSIKEGANNYDIWMEE